MAANAEWDIPFVLTSPYGTMNLNAQTGDRYLLLASGCGMGAPLRVANDNVPQADGKVIHPRFESGYECRLTMALWVDEEPACGADLVRMLDELNLHVRGLLNAGDNEGRLSWTPTGETDRMIDDVRLLEPLIVQGNDEGQFVVASFAIDSEYPYAQDLAQQSSAVGTITNTGTTAYWPVFQVASFGAWTLANTTTGEEIVYNGGASGSYIEIDTFRQTAYVDGNGANVMKNFDLAASDFWALQPGANIITGPSTTILWAPAWS